MLEIMHANQMTSFFEKVKTIRNAKQDWNIMEIAIVEEWVGKLTTEEIGIRLREAFSDNEGIGLICNAREVLCLIKWGQERGITELCARMEDNLPDQSCAVEGFDVTAEGIERVQVKLSGTVEGVVPIPQIRAKHTKEIILIASEDTSFKSSALPVFQEYAQVLFVVDFTKMIQVYKEKAPEMLIWDVETIRRGGEVPLKVILSMDESASIVCASNAIDAALLVETKKLGIESVVSKSIDKKTARQLIEKCPHFS